MPAASSTKADYNQTLTQDDHALKLASMSDYELLASGKPMSLKEFSKVKKMRDLPCLVKVRDGKSSLCDSYSFGLAQMFVVLEKKSTLVATCRAQADGSTYVVPVHTEAFELAPTAVFMLEHSRPQSLGKITAEELLQCKSLPPVIAVSEEFTLRAHSERLVPVGTLLFPKEVRKQAKYQRQVQGVLHAKSESGEIVNITPDCKGRFSVLARDVRISLQKALNHLKPPFTMRTISDRDTVYANIITVERIHKEDMLVGMMKATEGTTVEDVASFSRMAELPVSLNLTVVMMVPKQQKTLEQIYDYAHTGYYGVARHTERQPSTSTKKLVMHSNPSYSAIPMGKVQHSA
ncbi:MAG: hypothetical protein MPL62_17980, partial [Alphaproteobacteria bacterium]|nr:hypothetical protein [Alphaproteobacteria bacterium]